MWLTDMEKHGLLPSYSFIYASEVPHDMNWLLVQYCNSWISMVSLVLDPQIAQQPNRQCSEGSKRDHVHL